MAKRKLSKKQKAALARGRAKLFAKRRTSRKSTRKVSRKRIARKSINIAAEPLIIKEGEIMAGKKRRTRKRTSRKARRVVHVAGVNKVRRSRKTRRSYSRMSGLGLGKLNIMSTVTDMAGLAAGAVGSSYVAKMVPVKNAKVKALIPIAIGLGLGMTKFGRSPIAKAAAGGAIAVGTLSLVKSFFPTLPLLSGAEDAEGVAGAIDSLPEEERALLGLTVSGEALEGYDGELAGIDAPLSPSNVD